GEGGPRGGLESGLSEVVHRLRPQVAHESVMGELLDVSAEAIPVERLDRVDDPRVKLAPTLLQQAAIRDVVGERVFEGVLDLREEPRFVEKLRRLQPCERLPNTLLRLL